MQTYIHPASVCCALVMSIFVTGACYSYLPVRFSKKFIQPSDKGAYIYEDGKKDDIRFDVVSFEKNKKQKNSPKEARAYRVYLTRYFAKSIGFSQINKINNKGVGYAFNGRFKEAEILFLESIKENIEFVPAYNNLGIIFELFGLYDKAFKMYSKACLLEPQNEYFRRNFLYFHNKKKFSTP